MTSALDRKLLRDLRSMWGQGLAIALVIASGVATFVNSQTMLRSLESTRAAFYQRYRFAEVFASVKRAPDSLKARIAEIPGVAHVETRIVEGVNLVYKHVRRSQKHPQGGRLSKEMPISISNIMYYCSTCSKGVRLGVRYLEDGSKERFCKKCGTAAGKKVAPARASHATKK